MTLLSFALTALALIALLAILIEILRQGVPCQSRFVSLPAPSWERRTWLCQRDYRYADDGGDCFLLSIPFGVMTGIFLAEFGKETAIAGFVRFITMSLPLCFVIV